MSGQGDGVSTVKDLTPLSVSPHCLCCSIWWFWWCFLNILSIYLWTQLWCLLIIFALLLEAGWKDGEGFFKITSVQWNRELKVTVKFSCQLILETIFTIIHTKKGDAEEEFPFKPWLVVGCLYSAVLICYAKQHRFYMHLLCWTTVRVLYVTLISTCWEISTTRW